MCEAAEVIVFPGCEDVEELFFERGVDLGVESFGPCIFFLLGEVWVEGVLYVGIESAYVFREFSAGAEFYALHTVYLSWYF